MKVSWVLYIEIEKSKGLSAITNVCHLYYVALNIALWKRRNSAKCLNPENAILHNLEREDFMSFNKL